MDFTAPRLSFGAAGRPAFGRLAQHAEPAEDKTPGVFTTKAKERRALMFREARELLSALPGPGEAVHALMTGRYDLMLLLVAMLDLHPAPCRMLRITTLSFAARNAAELLSLLERKRIGGLTMLASTFFRQHGNRDLFDSFRKDLAAFPGCRIAAARSHCKVTTFDFADGTGLVVEGSANLRTNSNAEALVVVNDRALHDHHAAWIDEWTARHEGDEGDGEGAG